MSARWLAGAAALCTACSPDRTFVPIDEGCHELVDDVVYEHACQHGLHGPYETVIAAAERDGSPRVSSVQRAMNIRLPPPGLDTDGRVYFRYAPPREGQHVVFAGAEGREVPVSVYDGERLLAAVPVERVDTVMSTGMCGGMVEVSGYDLARGHDYLVELGPAPADAEEVRVFVEHLATFGGAWSTSCHL